MAENDASETYNYPHFAGTDDFRAFRTALPVGSPAADFPVIEAASKRAGHLSDSWRDHDLLIEFGSIT